MSLDLMMFLVERLCPARTGRAIIKVRSARFEPMASPYESMVFFSMPEVMATTNSGSEVARDITKKLIVYSEILSMCASLVDESINNLIAFEIISADMSKTTILTGKE